MKRPTRTARRCLTTLFQRAQSLQTFATSVALVLASPVFAEGFDLNSPRVDAPVRHADGSETFRLLPGECSDLEYFSSELQMNTSDCARRRNRIEYREITAARAGDRRLYEWEILIPDDFGYSGTGTRLIAGQFHTGTDMQSGFHLDNEGYTFRGRNCVSAEDFGDWHSISVQIHYDSTPRQSLRDQTPGVLVVECDGEVILDAAGRPNLAEGGEIHFRFGLFGAMEFPETDNVSVSFRNVRVSDW
ncbi:MAG: polysaccharide lyase [Rhodobacteraceae bacterium]|nr:polysaccharide lyase [Paracoccaceae bacterium]